MRALPQLPLPPSIIAAVCAIFLATVAAAAAPPTIEVGAPFPDIAFPVLDPAQLGETMAVSRFRGRKVVLHVFASW